MEHLEHCPIYWLPTPLLRLGQFSEVVFLRYRNKIRKRAFSLGSFVGEFGPEDPDVILRYYAPMTEEEMEARESDDDYYTEEEEDQEDEIVEEETVEETVEERVRSLDKAFKVAYRRGHAFGLLDRESGSEDDLEQYDPDVPWM